jgi:hypothetical protein
VFRYLFGDTRAIEIRAPRYKGRQSTVVSRFRPGDFQGAVAEVLRLSGNAPAIYAVMNGVDPSMPIGRSLRGATGPDGKYKGPGATAEDIPSRRHILIDSDPVRPSQTNATEEEKEYAKVVSEEAQAYLAGQGFSEPMRSYSGNGPHAIYPADLGCDEDTTLLVKSFLVALSGRFSNDRAKIDTGVHDLPRLVKVPETWVAKGPHSEDRPHRYSRILSIPEDSGFVTAEMLRAVVSDLAPPPAKPTLDVDAQIERKLEKSTNAPPPSRAFIVEATNGMPAEERARGYVFASEFPDSIAGEEGHKRLYRVACELVDGFGLTRTEAMPIFQEWNAAKAQPPESQRQLDHKLDDAIKNHPVPSLNRLKAEWNGKPSVNGKDLSPPEPEPWKPLRLGELPPVPDFPLDVLPEPVERLVVEAATSIGCDPAMVAGHVIPTAGGLIGRSASLLQGTNRFDHATVNLAVIAQPGDGKTPALDYAIEPVLEIDRMLVEDFEREKELYKSELKERLGKENGEDEEPEPPVLSRIWTDDVTMESVSRVLAASPRGVIMIRDELSSLILSLNQYKRGAGSDRPNLLKIWSSKPVLIDRVQNQNGEPVRIPFPFMCITGNCPPQRSARWSIPRATTG